MKDQHFMVDKDLIKRIVDKASLKKGEVILEIGAGTGNLTKELLGRGCRVIAVEKDEDLFNSLMRLGEKNLDIIHGNILDFLTKLRFDRIVSNIPYSITEPLFNQLIKMNFKQAVLTIPESFFNILKEESSKIAVMANIFFEIELMEKITKESFNPKPKTNSVVIILRPRKSKLKEEIILRGIFRKEKMLLKNAMMESLIDYYNDANPGLATKRNVKETINNLKINIDKRVSETNLNEIQQIIKGLRNLK